MEDARPLPTSPPADGQRQWDVSLDSERDYVDVFLPGGGLARVYGNGYTHVALPPQSA